MKKVEFLFFITDEVTGISSGVHKWNVHISRLSEKSWFSVGVYHDDETISHQEDYLSCYGISNSKYMFKNDGKPIPLEMAIWKEGDVIEVALDCYSCKVSFVNKRTALNETIALPADQKPWHLLLSLCGYCILTLE